MSLLIRKLVLALKNRLLRIEPDPSVIAQNIEEEMLETLERASSNGSIDLEEDEREMISSIFELGDTQVREVMVPRIEIKFVKEDQSVEDIRQIVFETGHSRLPLVREGIDDIIGVIFVKDLYLNLERLAGGEITLGELARKPLVVPEGKKLDELLRDMKRSRSHFAVVIDEYGGTAGMVTMEDVLEEIVGEIEDEYDSETPAVKQVGAGQYIVDANLSVEELNDEIKAGLPDGDFETVGGFIYDQAGSLPEEGHVVKKGNLKFVVDKISGQRIISVRVFVEKQQPEQE